MNNEYIMHKVHDYDLLWKDSSNTDGLVNNAALTVLIEGQHFTHIQCMWKTMTLLHQHHFTKRGGLGP
jgi:hypothetical protein